ncbi:hypothetical protein FQR65_LT19312 [Abscondita terminalis]|nr:hypothetical protein FQR65_LT19312 [Abscondita terminalis]
MMSASVEHNYCGDNNVAFEVEVGEEVVTEDLAVEVDDQIVQMPEWKSWNPSLLKTPLSTSLRIPTQKRSIEPTADATCSKMPGNSIAATLTVSVSPVSLVPSTKGLINACTGSFVYIAASTASQETEEENAFQALVNATRRNFRRPDVRTHSPRGRKRKASFSCKVLLTKLAHIDFLPGAVEQNYLKSMGLGEARKLLVVKRVWNIRQITDSIYLLYPTHIQNLLRMCGFNLAKCNRVKKISVMENIEDATDLE